MREQIRELLNTFLDDYDKGDPTVDWVFILVHRLASAGVVIKVPIVDGQFEGVEFYPVESLLESPKGESNANRPG